MIKGLTNTEWRVISGIEEPYSLSEGRSAVPTTNLATVLHRRSIGEDVTRDMFIEAYLNDYGVSVEHFESLIDYAIENDDYELSSEILEMEKHMDEMLYDLVGPVSKKHGV